MFSVIKEYAVKCQYSNLVNNFTEKAVMKEKVPTKLKFKSLRGTGQYA